MGEHNGKVIGVISIKGGVGKTTTVSNLGAAFAAEFGQKVLLVDANYSAPNLGLHLGIVEPDHSIHDVLNDKVPVQEAIIHHQFGFDVLAASLTQNHVKPFKLKSKLDPLKSEYDVILIDSSPNLNEEVLSTMIASDMLLVVSSPDYPTLSCTMHAVKVAKARKTPIAGLILNKTRNKKFELTTEEIEDATGTPVLAVVPDDVKILEALSQTTPASIYAPLQEACVQYKHLAACLIGTNYNDPRLLTKVKSLIWRNKTRDEVNRLLFKEGKLSGAELESGSVEKVGQK